MEFCSDDIRFEPTSTETVNFAGAIAEGSVQVNLPLEESAILTEQGSFSPALSGHAVGATRNSVKCP